MVASQLSLVTGHFRRSQVTVMRQHLLTILLVMAASDLITPEGVAAATTAWETPPAALYNQDSGAIQSPGETLVHITDDNSNNNPRNPQPYNATPGQQQQQEASSTPARQEHRNMNTPGGGGGHDSGVVDTILAALVDYSKDPALWRSVHSVVDELDYSQRANHPPAPSAPRPPRPALRLTQPHTRWWGKAAGSRREKNQGGNEKSGGGNTSGDIKIPTSSTTTTSAAPTAASPQLPWLQQPPEDPSFIPQMTLNNSTSTSMSSVAGSDRVNFVRSQSSPPPHFLFHRVFVNETFDNHTRQPYRRPVLALMAVGKTSSKSEKGELLNSSSHTLNESRYGAVTKDLTDKYYSLAEMSVTPRHFSESRKGKETTEDGNEEYGGDVNESQEDLISAHHHHHHHHHHHRLHTFKSQLKFLQRWEERLWRRSHFRPQHSGERL